MFMIGIMTVKSVKSLLSDVALTSAWSLQLWFDGNKQAAHFLSPAYPVTDATGENINHRGHDSQPTQQCSLRIMVD